MEGMLEIFFYNIICLVVIWCIFLFDFISKVKDKLLLIEILRIVE